MSFCNMNVMENLTNTLTMTFCKLDKGVCGVMICVWDCAGVVRILTKGRNDKPHYQLILCKSPGAGADHVCAMVSMKNNAFSQYMYRMVDSLHHHFNDPISRDVNFYHITAMAMGRTLGCGIMRNGQGEWNPNDLAIKDFGKAGTYNEAKKAIQSSDASKDFFTNAEAANSNTSTAPGALVQEPHKTSNGFDDSSIERLNETLPIMMATSNRPCARSLAVKQALKNNQANFARLDGERVSESVMVLVFVPRFGFGFWARVGCRGG